ncbi:DUF1684 domain-containing protein [Hymenobacter sp. NST-14]|nr:DUF1684 domain-containing protein [Hymenobacter piscis]
MADALRISSSYCGGHYLDLRRGQGLYGAVFLDFNRVRNPCCAYGPGCSCPVPPPENRLTRAVKASVRSDYQ